jgi:hypothetical protein
MNKHLWKMKNGEWIKISDMTTSHIEACLSMLKRKGYIGHSTLTFYLSCQEPNGDGAQVAFDQEFDAVCNAKTHPAYDALEAELKFRKEQAQSA